MFSFDLINMLLAFILIWNVFNYLFGNDKDKKIKS